MCACFPDEAEIDKAEIIGQNARGAHKGFSVFRFSADRQNRHQLYVRFIQCTEGFGGILHVRSHRCYLKRRYGACRICLQCQQSGFSVSERQRCVVFPCVFRRFPKKGFRQKRFAFLQCVEASAEFGGVHVPLLRTAAQQQRDKQQCRGNSSKKSCFHFFVNPLFIFSLQKYMAIPSEILYNYSVLIS